MDYMRSPRFLILAFAIFVSMSAVVGIVNSTYSQCPDGASESEVALRATYNCTNTLINWHRQVYRTMETDWAAWGYYDPCNLNRAYAKALNASYLLQYGLSNNIFRWHGTVDYRDIGEALWSPAHNQIRYLPEDTEAWLAYAQTDLYRTKLGCLLFKSGDSRNNPVTRSGDYIHEGWHHWQWTYYQAVGHIEGPSGACQQAGNACDYYWWHRVGDYAIGEMWKMGWAPSGRRLYHSPNQAQVEYLCDLAEYAAAFVPTIVRDLARSEANIRLSERFVNVVPYRCGDPRPW